MSGTRVTDQQASTRACKSWGGSHGDQLDDFGAVPASRVNLVGIVTVGANHAFDHRSTIGRRGLRCCRGRWSRDRYRAPRPRPVSTGLTLAEGRSLLAKVQSVLVAKQVTGWSSGQTHCRRCRAALSHKDSRSTVLRTIYGKVTVKSPRLWSCACQQTSSSPRQVIHPLSKALPSRVTPELEYLQAKWAAHLPYRQATSMLKEVLPLDKGISFSGTRDRIRVLGMQIDADIERDIVKLPKAVADVQVRESSHVASVSVDSAWLRHCDSVGGQGRHVNIVVGRATFTDGIPKLYAYVHKKVTSAGARLDQFLSRNGVGIDERVTLISDDAGEFDKAVEGSQLVRGRILDWFPHRDEV